MEMRMRLRTEFRRRADRNPRYSIRAFARALDVHHTTLARILDGRRGLSRSMLQHLASRLSMSPDEIRAARSAEDARRVLDAASAPDFRADCRWIAMKTGIDIDDVNRALHHLIYERRLVMRTPGTWTVIS
jgi:plasmid maintenance system antidote protein VapI